MLLPYTMEWIILKKLKFHLYKKLFNILRIMYEDTHLIRMYVCILLSVCVYPANSTCTE
jgi:hypothetical protein